MDEQLRADLARRMGMKAREVTAVVEVDDGHAVTTHDGHTTLVRADGSMVFDLPEAEWKTRATRAAEQKAAAKATKTAPKKA